MSFTLLSKLRKSLASVRKPSYTASHVAVMTCLADRINDKTGICFPSMQTIADESYIGERQARKVVSQLEQDGVVEVVRFPRKSNHYRLNLPLKSGTGSNDIVGFSNELNPGLQDPATGGENRATVAEARLTYNLNQSFNPASDLAILPFPLQDTASQSFLPEAGSKTLDPVTSSRELPAPCNGVEDVHALLMRKLRKESPGPSAEDRKRLQAGITKYGLSEVHQMVEWVFKNKNKFWRERLKAANFPCSFLCDSLGTIKKQSDDARHQNTDAAVGREQERIARKAAQREDEQRLASWTNAESGEDPDSGYISVEDLDD